MSAAEKLEALRRGHQRVIPVFRKTGPRHGGADAFSRARDIEIVMDALPQIRALVEAADKAAASLHLEAHVGDVFRLSVALAALNEKLGEK